MDLWRLSSGKGAATFCFLIAVSFVTAKYQYRLLARKKHGQLASKTVSATIELNDEKTLFVLQIFHLDGYPVTFEAIESSTMKDVCDHLLHDYRIGIYEVECEISPMQELLPAEMTVGELVSRWKAKHWPDAKLVVPIYVKDWSPKLGDTSIPPVHIEGSDSDSPIPSASKPRRRSFNVTRRSSVLHNQGGAGYVSSAGNAPQCARIRITRDDIDLREYSTTTKEFSREPLFRRNLPHSGGHTLQDLLQSVNDSTAAATTTAESVKDDTACPISNATPNTLAECLLEPQEASLLMNLKTSIENANQPNNDSLNGTRTEMVDSRSMPCITSPFAQAQALARKPAPDWAQWPIATLDLPAEAQSTLDNSSDAAAAAAAEGGNDLQSSFNSEKVQPRSTFVHLTAGSSTHRASNYNQTRAAASTTAMVTPETLTDRSPQSDTFATAECSPITPTLTSTDIPTAGAVTNSSIMPAPHSAPVLPVSVSEQEIHVVHARTNAMLNRFFKHVEEKEDEHHTENATSSSTIVQLSQPAGGDEESSQAVTHTGQQVDGNYPLNPPPARTASRSTSPASATATTAASSNVYWITPQGSSNSGNQPRSRTNSLAPLSDLAQKALSAINLFPNKASETPERASTAQAHWLPRDRRMSSLGSSAGATEPAGIAPAADSSNYLSPDSASPISNLIPTFTPSKSTTPVSVRTSFIYDEDDERPNN